MPVARFQMPDGRVARFEVPEGTTPEQANALISQQFGETAPAPEMPAQEQKAPKTLLGKMWANAKQGGRDLADFATMDYPDVGEGEFQQILKKKRQEGTADRLDYQRAFLEGMGNSPGGKFLGAVGGLVPEFNIATTAIKDYINPAIVEKTGADESTVALAEMGLTAPFIVKAARTPAKGNQLPSIRGAGAATKAITYPIRHPIDTAMGTLKTGANITNSAIKPVVQPVVRSIIEGDNPITGEPGLRTALQSDVAAEGARLGKKFNVNFSAGELTANPTAMGIEDALANSARWGGKFSKANQAKTENIVKGFNETLDKIYPQSSTRTDVGNRISAAYNNTINNLVKTRRTQAQADAQAADIATRGKPVVDPANFRQVLSKFIEEGNSPTATPAQRAAASEASSMLDALKASPPKQSTIIDPTTMQPARTATELQPWKKLTARDVQNGLATYGDGAKTGGGIWKNISTASDRRFSIAAKEALQADLNAAADSGIPEAAALKAFRNNYREASAKISDLEKTTVGKIVGGAERNSAGELVLSPELVADKFTKMEPTEIRNTLQFLDKNQPEVAQMVRRYTLERALMQAMEGKGLRGEGTTKDFAKAEFVRQLPDQQKLSALLKDPVAAKDVRDVAAAMNRLIDYGSERGNSATAQRTDFLASISRWGKGAFYRSIVSDSLAEDLLNPQKRMAIAKEVRENSPKTKSLK